MFVLYLPVRAFLLYLLLGCLITNINYINDKFKDITLEDAAQEKSRIHKEHAYFSVIQSAYGELQDFQEAWHH